MRTESRAWVVFGGFIALLWLALSSDRGAWFHVAEAIVGVVILAAAGGFMSSRRSAGSGVGGSR